MRSAHREGGLWLAHIVHRISGLCLALFLPVHFAVLGLAIEGAAALDPFLKIAELPVAKIGEFVLVALLGVHLLGGLRLLAAELLSWTGHSRTWAMLAGAVSVCVAAVFFLSAITKGHV